MKIVIIGSNGHHPSALEGIKATPGAQVTGAAPGLAEESLDGLLENCRKWLGKAPPVFSDYRQMLEREKPDAAVINSFYYRNGPLALECLQRKIPCYVEKPIATEMKTLLEIRRQWRSNPAVHLISMQELRYIPAFTTAWHYIQQGAIGRPLLLTAQKSYPLGQRPDFYRKRETYGGTIPWVGSHAVDAIHWFAGADFRSVYASHSTLANQGIGTMETFATMQFKMTNGSLAVAHLDYLRSVKADSWGDDRIRVMGERGAVEVRDETVTVHQPGQPPFQIPVEPRRLVFAEFLRLVATGEKMLLTPEECLRSSEVSLIARQSADEDRVIEIPPA